MSEYPVEIVNDVAILAAKIATVLEKLTENQGDTYVTKVEFGFHGDPYEGITVEPNEHGGYSIFAKNPTT